MPIIMRLDKDIDIIKLMEAYAKAAPPRTRAMRVQKSFRARGCSGLPTMDYLQMEQFGDMVNQFFFQLQRSIENPIIQFRNIVGKIAYIASLILKSAICLSLRSGSV